MSPMKNSGVLENADLEFSGGLVCSDWLECWLSLLTGSSHICRQPLLRDVMRREPVCLWLLCGCYVVAVWLLVGFNVVTVWLLVGLNVVVMWLLCGC